MRALAFAALLIALFASGCGGDGDNDPAPTTAAGTPAASPASGDTATPSGTACSPARERAPGSSRATLTHDGVERAYVLHVPGGYDGATAAPLVVALHGLGMSADSMLEMTSLDTAAGERGMVLVVPEGTGRQPAWNIDDVPAGPDDVAFLNALIAELQRALCIDASRVYATGFSNGAAMAQKLACEMPGRLAAIGLVAATYRDCAADVPLIAFHGSADTAAPFQGGAVPPGVTLPPVPQAIMAWAAAVGCAEPPAIASLAEDIRVAVYDGCPSTRSEVQLYTVLEGGHTWPGSRVEIDGAGRTTDAIEATGLILDFFGDYAIRPD